MKINLKRFFMWFDWFWQEQNAIQYETRIKLCQKKINEAAPFASFYRDYANELRNKLEE